jgi:hypothetical protein
MEFMGHTGMIWVGLCCFGFVYVELRLLVLILGTVGSSCKEVMPCEEEAFALVKYPICCGCRFGRACVDVVFVSMVFEQSRTVVAENLPEDHFVESMEQLFGRVGLVKMVRICSLEAANGANSTAAKHPKADMVVSNKVREWRDGVGWR